MYIGSRYGGFRRGDYDLIQPTHVIASRVDARHGSLLVWVDAQSAALVQACPHIGGEPSLGRTSQGGIEDIEKA